jgi:hypothetical protein
MTFTPNTDAPEGKAVPIPRRASLVRNRAELWALS